jgi:ankyrin repeat protein
MPFNIFTNINKMFFGAKTEADIDNLISSGADINAQDYLFGQTFLHVLVQSSSPLFDYFLSKNPNPNIQNKDGKTPLFYAKDTQTIESLIKHGASLFVKDFNGNSITETNSLVVANFMVYYINKIKNGVVA